MGVPQPGYQLEVRGAEANLLSQRRSIAGQNIQSPEHEEDRFEHGRLPAAVATREGDGVERLSVFVGEVEVQLLDAAKVADGKLQQSKFHRRTSD